MHQPDMKARFRRRYAVVGLLTILGLLFAYYTGDQAGSVASSGSFTIDTLDADPLVRGTSLLASKDSVYFIVDTRDPDSVTQARAFASSKIFGFFTINTLDPDSVVFAVSRTSSELSGYFTIDTMADGSTLAESGYFTIDTRDPDTLTRAISIFAVKESGWFTIDTLDPLLDENVTITTALVSQVVTGGASVTFTVVATGTTPLTYVWKKDGAALSAATNASYSISTVQSTDAGTYTVVVSNTGGSMASSAAVLAVIDAHATQSVAGPGYFAGGTVTLTQTLTYSGTCSGLGWQMLLPVDWSYAAGGGTEGDVKPVVGTTSLLEWSWTNVPPSPVTFTATLNVPADQSGDKNLTALAIFRVAAGAANVLAEPDPLTVARVTFHSADSDGNSRISLLELTRVIELYNTRNGTTRTGCYVLQAGTEDGFAADPVRAGGTTINFATYYAADSNHDGKISLLELTRVIEIYNYRSGTTRTGQYHAQSGTEDGFAPGP